MDVSFSRKYQELNETDKKLVMMRLKRKTYIEIMKYVEAHSIDYSYRKVRRIIDNVLHHNLVDYEESKYSFIFKMLNWSPIDFEEILKLPRIVFMFLNYHIPECGKIPIPKNISKTEFSNDFVINNISFPCSVNSIVFWTLFLNPDSKRKRGYSSKDMEKIASQAKIDISYNEFKLSLQSLINSIEVLEGEYLFFDNSKLNSNKIKFINSVKKKKGVYSIDKIFNDNCNFYESLGINSCLSLYDIIKKYKNIFQINEQINVLTYPNIIVGYKSKKEFFQVLAKQFQNQSIDNVVESLHINNGLAREYVQYSFKAINRDQLRKDGIIKPNNATFTNRQIEDISKKLKSDYYNHDDFFRVIRKIRKSATKDYVDTEDLVKLGYRKEYNYYVRINIICIRRHIEKKFLSHDFIKIEKESPLYSIELSTIDVLVSNFKLVKISDEEYITASKLKRIGIFKKDILAFIEQVFLEVQHNQYFTINQLFDSDKYDFIKHSCFDKYFFQELIDASKKFEKLRIGGEVLFCKSTSKVTQKDFIKWCFESFDEKIDISDVLKWIYEKFRINVSQYMVKSLAEVNGLYYDESFERIYKEKKYFLMEVFDNE